MELNSVTNFFSGKVDLFDCPFEPSFGEFCDFGGNMLEDDLFQEQTLSTDDKPLEIPEDTKTTFVAVSENSDIIESLESLVRREIEDKGIEAVVKQCAEHETKKCFVRDRSDKSEMQVKAMVEALEPGKTQLVKWKRVKLGKKIGLTESQIYKWYYDTYKSS